MTFSILEVVLLLIVSNLGSYALGRYRAKRKPTRCRHVYEIIEELPGKRVVWVCRHCGDVIEVNINKEENDTRGVPRDSEVNLHD